MQRSKNNHSAQHSARQDKESKAAFVIRADLKNAAFSPNTNARCMRAKVKTVLTTQLSPFAWPIICDVTFHRVRCPVLWSMLSPIFSACVRVGLFGKVTKSLTTRTKFTACFRNYSSSSLPPPTDKPVPAPARAAVESTQVRISCVDGSTPSQIGTRRPKHNLITRQHKNSIGGMSTTTTSASNENTSTANGANKDTDDSIIWIDCEMTGLDVETEVIMEVACIITGPDLNEVARHPSIVIQVPEEKLKSMHSWCIAHHGRSGLTEDCRKSQVTTTEAEKMLLTFVQKHTRSGKCPIGGNSICMDRVFLRKYMPTLYDHFHYRSIDVSTIKELVRRWYPKDYNLAGSKKRWAHRTLEDIEDSINELRLYKSNVFRQP